MKLTVVNPKTGLAMNKAASVVEATTGKRRAKSPEITARFEIFFDADHDTWYCADTLTRLYRICDGRRDCEIEVAIRNFEHVRSLAQLRLFR